MAGAQRQHVQQPLRPFPLQAPSAAFPQPLALPQGVGDQQAMFVQVGHELMQLGRGEPSRKELAFQLLLDFGHPPPAIKQVEQGPSSSPS